MRRPRVYRVPIQGPRAQGVPRIGGGGGNQEQFARSSQEYFEDGCRPVAPLSAVQEWLPSAEEALRVGCIGTY